MQSITKKRIGAYFIDLAISTAVTTCAEYFLRKRIKSETFHSGILPAAIMCSLEYVQLKRGGQTLGYRQMGLVLESEDGSKLTGKQIVKRMAYRDMVSTFKYIGDRASFEKENGAILPQDMAAGTIVKEIR